MDTKEKKIRQYICSNCQYTDEAVETLPKSCPRCGKETLREKVMKHN